MEQFLYHATWIEIYTAKGLIHRVCLPFKIIITAGPNNSHTIVRISPSIDLHALGEGAPPIVQINPIVYREPRSLCYVTSIEVYRAILSVYNSRYYNYCRS